MSISTFNAKKMLLFSIVLAFFFLGCDTLNKAELQFATNYNSLLSSYQPGDTLYFFSNSGDIDTITVSTVDSYESFSAGIMGWPHRNVIIRIKHLPNNLWSAGTEFMQHQNPKILDQELIVVEKTPNLKNQYFIGIDFRDFSVGLDTFPSTVTGDLLTSLDIREYWSIKTESAIESQNEYSVTDIIWTTKFGLTGYYKKNGEFYLLCPSTKSFLSTDKFRD